MNSTTDSKTSRYDDLVWTQEMKLALDDTNVNILSDVAGLALSRIGFPGQAYTVTDAVHNRDKGWADHRVATMTVKLPKGEVTLRLTSKVPATGAIDQTILISFGGTVATVLNVDSYELIADAAYRAIKNYIIQYKSPR